ncbi:hypothetical protein EV674_1142 [Simplicispira metamorpha]|uniref:Uncharacterized protein n=1 Tax=Simplicispira metamorpha TaxID=80881 RepID=A0A4R2N7V9_9BURK|nr:hypothetical protein EV674_1142 [Simplicispira metamorpha]
MDSTSTLDKAEVSSHALSHGKYVLVKNQPKPMGNIPNNIQKFKLCTACMDLEFIRK